VLVQSISVIFWYHMNVILLSSHLHIIAKTYVKTKHQNSKQNFQKSNQKIQDSELNFSSELVKVLTLFHTIPLQPDAKPFRQKQKPINPTTAPKMQKELLKMKEGGIKPIRHSEWVSNLVPVRKQNREIRLYVDFRNLIIKSLKDNYPLPSMDHLLQKVTGS